AKIEKMLDALVASEGEPDLVQISGGEPTLHPDFFAILDAVRAGEESAKHTGQVKLQCSVISISARQECCSWSGHSPQS
ncbi:hypothetical protein E3H11_43905, partial [Bradyrhizobium brasilense]